MVASATFTTGRVTYFHWIGRREMQLNWSDEEWQGT